MTFIPVWRKFQASVYRQLIILEECKHFRIIRNIEINICKGNFTHMIVRYEGPQDRYTYISVKISAF